jgi:hypothetical protein
VGRPSCHRSKTQAASSTQQATRSLVSFCSHSTATRTSAVVSLRTQVVCVPARVAIPQISALCPTYDGRYLLTAGGEDGTIMMWRVSLEAMHTIAQAGGEGLTPFLSLLEGGAEGAFYQEICDFFAYA